MTHFSELTKIRENPKTNKKKLGHGKKRPSEIHFFKKKQSDIFDKTDEKCPNRPENQELGPILGQNGDPDLIKLFPALLGQKKTLKNQKMGQTMPEKKYQKNVKIAYLPSLLTP